MLSFIWSKLRIFLKNPMVLFIYGIVSKWYVAVMVTVLMVTYWVLKGLSDAGVIDSAEKVVFRAFRDAKAVAQHCVPKITNLAYFWNCLESPPEYTPSKEEESLQKSLEDLVDINKYVQPEDPYEEKN